MPRRLSVTEAAAWSGMAILACDDRVIYPDGSGGAASSTNATVGTGGYGECTTPSGLRVCRGPNECDPDCACVPADFMDDSVLGICANGPINDQEPWLVPWSQCPDGYLFMGKYTYCVPEEIGQMFCLHGQEDYISCTDLGSYDCAGLPEPRDCPATSGIRLCGDACGPCGPGETCRGRSNQHPYSMCIPSTGGSGCSRLDASSCPADRACFIYTVQPLDQPRADARGICLPLAQCLAAAAELPGGGECLGG